MTVKRVITASAEGRTMVKRGWDGLVSKSTNTQTDRE